MGVKPLNKVWSCHAPPFMLYSQPETVFSVMLVAVLDNNVGVAGVVWVAFVTVAELAEATSPVQLAAVTITVIVLLISAATKV